MCHPTSYDAGVHLGEAHGPEDDRAALTAAMDRYADGDTAAFEEVYDLLAPRLKAFFLRSTRDHGRAEDLVQQTLLQIHRARQCFVRGSDVRPWAFAIGRRLLIDSRRRLKNEVLFESAEADAQALELGVSLDGAPDELTQTKEMAARAQAELSRLPEPQRAAYELVRGDGLSVAEAAEVLGTTTAAVKQRLFRAYEALRCALGISAAVGASRAIPEGRAVAHPEIVEPMGPRGRGRTGPDFF
jgi:RNA polymerase sigma-70 factor (ECF subfamily)